jgi:hypothetical protein
MNVLVAGDGGGGGRARSKGVRRAGEDFAQAESQPVDSVLIFFRLRSTKKDMLV